MHFTIGVGVDPDIVRDAKLSNLSFAGQPSQDDAHKSKTPLRLRFEAEARVIQSRLGDLDKVRERLGLSQRKLAELLFVDPSAITRWQKDPETIPPWVWRSLSWYMELEGKEPNWAQWREWFLKKGMRDVQSAPSHSVKRPASEDELLILRQEIDQARGENQKLKEQMDAKEALGLTWKALLLLNSLAWLGFVALKVF